MSTYSKTYSLQRKSAFLLVFLVPWFLFKAIALSKLSFAEICLEFKNIQTVLFTALLLIAGLYHGYIGLNVICNDYIACQKIRNLTINCLAIFLGLSALLGCFCLMLIFVQG
jgi:succinate dehydrogenase hydrophobic membrane anchor protein